MIRESDQADLIRRFDDRVRQAVDCSKALNYNPTAFVSMVGEHGYLGATQILLRADRPQTGFERLWSLGRLDLTMEWIALEREFRELFTDKERAVARHRLAEVDCIGPPT